MFRAWHAAQEHAQGTSCSLAACGWRTAVRKAPEHGAGAAGRAAAVVALCSWPTACRPASCTLSAAGVQAALFSGLSTLDGKAIWVAPPDYLVANLPGLSG
eukprot:359623-Chlamydomonas_euryale.AAC.1